MLENKRPGKRRIFHRTLRASKVPLSLRLEDRKHLPKCTDGKTGRVRCEHCNNHTNTYCSKCKAFLCLFSKRNCYYTFHGGSDSDYLDSDSENEDNDSNHASDADSESNLVLSDADIGEQQPVENVAANENNEI